MKKKTAGIIYGVLLFGVLFSVVQAQVSSPNFFKKIGNSINLIQSAWELGSDSSRISKGWFTNLDTTNATIGTLQISSQVSPGPLSVAASSNPDIRFTGDPNTGLSWIDADRMALMTGGTNRLTVNSSGNVGIGTAGPGYKLEVRSSDTGNDVLAVTDSNSILYKVRRNSDGSGTFWTYDGAGAPNAALGGAGYLIVGTSNPVNTIDAAGGVAIGSYAGVNTAPSNGLIISGNVGIGTTGPQQKLEINGGMRLNTATAKPTCDATTRGTFWFVKAAAGVKDDVQVCGKDAGDAYDWRVLY